jgi:hypothetical protein
MEEIKPIPSLIKVTATSTLFILSIFIPGNIDGTTQVTRFPIGTIGGSGTNESSHADLLVALSLAHGNYERLVNEKDLLSDLQTADIVLIGEAHHDQRDMQTAFEITRQLAHRRNIALAVERFPLSLQPSLDALNTIDSEELREEALRKILQTEEYKTVWRPDSFDSSYLNNPSAEAFEAMMFWAVQKRIPIIGLDLSLSERELGYGENIPYRNELWKDQIVNFLVKYQSEDYMVIAIGGIDHFSNASDSVQASIKNHPSNFKVLSIGQRDANYSTKSSLQVEDLALSHKISDLILLTPQFAVVQQNGSPIFPTPPDYWIAVHLVDSWENNTD